MLALVAFCLEVTGQIVMPNEAASAASAFFQKQGKTMTRCAKTLSRNGNNLLYIFNAESGYVVISGDKRTTPVLAFSDRQLYNDDDIIPPAKMWLDNYADQITDLQQNNDVTEINPAWIELLDRRSGMRDGNAIEPLMQSHWGQEEKYNYYCPRDFAGYNNRVVTGCVATALAQLIYYFRWPETGTGSYSYVDENYGLQSADYANATYDYSAMCDNPTDINLEISKLIHHIGVGVDMHYGTTGSGMYNHSAAYVLRTYFKYSPETQYVFRDTTTMDWDSLIISHLERGIPLYYAGWSVPDTNGHGFICDGYRVLNDEYYYHFNFGWDGSHDNYFLTTHLNTSGTHFNLAQELIVNAYPDTNLYEYPVSQALTGGTTLTSNAGSFHAAEQANAHTDFTWHIRPTAANVEKIVLNVRYALDASDTLWVTPIGAGLSPLMLTDTSNTLNVNWTCDEIDLRYAGSAEKAKLFANYYAQITQFCESTASFNTVTGSFGDGSGDADYNPLTFCQYRIVLTSKPLTNIHFTEFDLGEGDTLFVFNNVVSRSNLIAAYSGHMPDTTITFTERRLQFVFETDEQSEGAGWQVEYEGTTDIAETENADFQLYPNPVQNLLTISGNTIVNKAEIFNAMGQLLMEVEPQSNHFEISMEDFPKGIYLVKIIMEEGTFMQKVVK